MYTNVSWKRPNNERFGKVGFNPARVDNVTAGGTKSAMDLGDELGDRNTQVAVQHTADVGNTAKTVYWPDNDVAAFVQVAGVDTANSKWFSDRLNVSWTSGGQINVIDESVRGTPARRTYSIGDDAQKRQLTMASGTYQVSVAGLSMLSSPL